MNKPTTRREKIKLLMDLQTGKLSVSEIKPMIHRVWIQDKQDRDLFFCSELQIKTNRSFIDSFDPTDQKIMNIVIDYSREPQSGINTELAI
jgi:hypothetical protein